MRPTTGSWAALVLGAACATGTAAETTRYVTISDTLGQIGSQVVERADDGLVSVRYVYKNNGRGPELTERFRLAPDGTFSEYRVQGKATMDGPVDERYSRSGDRAEWQSTSEQGSASVDGPALYVPLWSSYEPNSVALAALLRRADGRLPLLPGGTLSQRRIDELEVERAGERRRVQLLVQTGIGLQPFFLWATTGDAPRLFAVSDLRGEYTVEEGWEASRAALEASQRLAEQAVLRDRARELRHPLPGLTVVRNARVFDSAAARLLPPQDVYVLRGRITAVLPAGSPAAAPDNEIDAAGRVLLPGLFDMHGHVDRWGSALWLASGVTTVRDLGNDNAALQRMLDDTAAGTLLAPQLVPCGFLEGRSPFASALGITIETLDQAKAAVDWYAERGYPQLKIYNSFPKAILRETVAYAHARGMRVSGHVPAFLRAQDVVEQGYDEIQHINQVLLNFLVTPSTDTRTLERFKLPADKLATMDFDAAPVRRFVAMLAQRRIVIDPTLAAFDFIEQRDGEVAASSRALVDHVPPDVRRWLRTGALEKPDAATAQRHAKSYAKMVDFVGRMYRAGVPLVAGTDSWALALPAEFELYVQAGIPPAKVLQIATRQAAAVARAGNRGAVEAGKLADLILVDGDPTVSIGDIRRVALVLTQGHWLAPKEIHEAIGITPFVAATPAVRQPALH